MSFSIYRDGGSDDDDQSLVASLQTRIAELEAQHATFEKMILEYSSKTLAPNRELVKMADETLAKGMETTEQLNKLHFDKIELQKKNGNLIIDVQLVRKENLILQKKIVILEQERMDDKLEMARRGVFLDRPGPSDS